MRSATAILYRNIVFLHRLHLFFWTNCFVSKNIIVFSRVSLFLSGANLPVFSVHFPFALLVNCNISQVLRQSHCIFAINKKAPHRTLLKKDFVRSLLDELRVDFSMYLLPLCFSLGSSHCLVCYDNILWQLCHVNFFLFVINKSHNIRKSGIAFHFLSSIRKDKSRS